MSTYDDAPAFETGALPLSPIGCDEHAIPTPTSARPTSKIIGYGPWSPTCPAIERRPQLRCLLAIIACHHGSARPLIALRRAGETNPVAFTEAQAAFETLPALTSRRLLVTHAAVMWPRRLGGG
jgi:hypothetical protein